MPQGERVKTIEIGKNHGLISNQTAHGADPQSFREYLNVVHDRKGAIRKRPGIGVAKGGTAASGIVALHEFTRVNPTTGAETHYIFRAFGTSVQRWNGAAWVAETLPYAPAGSAWFFYNHNNRCLLCNGKDLLLVFDGSTGADGRTWWLAGVEPPAAAATYSLSTPVTGGTLTATKGSLNITKVGGAAWTSAADGKPIDINGNRYTVNTVSGADALTITETFKEENYVGTTYAIYTGLQSWAVPPRYAYAYYNPTTGHCSLISPITEITEQDVESRTVTLLGILYSAAAYNNGFTEIKIFRSGKNATTLAAIDTGVINNSNLGGSTTFTESALTYKDVNLTDIEAPTLFEKRPPAGIASIAAWDDRAWYLVPKGNAAPAPPGGRLFYAANLAETIFVPEESAPEKFNQMITSARGLLPLGAGESADGLLIQTAYGDRTVVGSDPLSYRPRRLPTREAPGHQGGAVVVGGQLVQLYGDRRLIDYGRGIDLGSVIQDKLKALRASLFTGARLFWFSEGDRNYLLLSGPKTGASVENDVTYVFDMDAGDDVAPGVWYEWGVGFSCFAVVHAADGSRQLWAGRPSGDVVALFADGVFVDGVTEITPSIKTAHWRFDGQLVRLKYIRAWVTDPTKLPTAKIYVDEETAVGATSKSQNLTFTVPQLEYQDSANLLVAIPVGTIRGSVMQIQADWPAAAGVDYGIEKLQAVFQLESEAEEDL